MRIALLASLLCLVSSLASANSVSIQWRCPTCAADGVIGYNVRLGTTPGGPYPITQTYGAVQPAPDGIVTVPFSLQGLPPGKYYDVIEAFNLDTTSPPSPVEREIIVPEPVEQLLPSAMALALLRWLA